MADPDYTKYTNLRDNGVSEIDVYQQFLADGQHSFVECIRMLRHVFHVDLRRAKEISLQADGIANSIDEHEASLAPALEEALRLFEDEDRETNAEE